MNLMKIECTINNYFKTYNEARGVVLNKKKILRKRNSRCMNYLTRILLTLLFVLLIVIMMSITKSLCLYDLGVIILFIELVNIAFTLASNITFYVFRKKRNFTSTIVINEEGLIDTSFQGIKMIFSWDKIKGVVIKKYSITILTDTSCYFYFDIKSKEDILKAVEKYGSKDLIIS